MKNISTKEASKNRTASHKGVNERNEMKITNLNPRKCPYNNPPGFRYVEATVYSPTGKVISEGLHCISNDQIFRITASQKKK